MIALAFRIAACVYFSLAILYWLASTYALWRMRTSVPYLDRINPPEPETRPRVSVIVPAYGMIRAAVLGRRRGGIAWRGTVYSAEELKGGSRIPFP